MKQLLALFIIFNLSYPVFGMINLDQFDLTDKQISLLYKFEDKGWGEEKLSQLAKAMHNHNIRQRRVEYVPPHDMRLLLDVRKWASAAAFFNFVKYTRFEMNKDQYLKDCPSWEVFNFGRATGTQYFRIDVLEGVYNMNDALQTKLVNHPEDFENYFLELATSLGFDKYIR